MSERCFSSCLHVCIFQPHDPGLLDKPARPPLGCNRVQHVCSEHFGCNDQPSKHCSVEGLVFEGHTLVLGQLRELVIDPNAAASRKMPAVEREHRMQQLRTRLNRVVLERQLEPSHELLESMMQQKEGNQLILIERCTSREWEITMGENKRQPALDSEKLAIKEKSDVPDQAHASEPPRTLQFFALLTSKCASRHKGVHFFNISTSKSGPNMRCFVQFDLEMCFAPQRCALGISASKSGPKMRVFCTF